jgi:hypothetical protein
VSYDPLRNKGRINRLLGDLERAVGRIQVNVPSVPEFPGFEFPEGITDLRVRHPLAS